MRFIGQLLGIGATVAPADGFGQSLIDDARFLYRFWRCRRRDVVFGPATFTEAQAPAVHPVVGRFGDATVGEAMVDGRRWIVRERDWHGWPDPPRYVLIVLDGAAVWCAADFRAWPEAWGEARDVAR